MKAFLRVLRRRISIMTAIFVIFVATFAGQAECEAERPSSDYYYLATAYDEDGKKICSFVSGNNDIGIADEWAILLDKDASDRVFSSRFVSRIEIKKIKRDDDFKIPEDKIEGNNEEDESAPTKDEFAPAADYY